MKALHHSLKAMSPGADSQSWWANPTPTTHRPLVFRYSNGGPDKRRGLRSGDKRRDDPPPSSRALPPPPYRPQTPDRLSPRLTPADRMCGAPIPLFNSAVAKEMLMGS